jgi:hypothetical protein
LFVVVVVRMLLKRRMSFLFLQDIEDEESSRHAMQRKRQVVKARLTPAQIEQAQAANREYKGVSLYWFKKQS